MLDDAQHNDQSYDAAGPRSRRHLASFAASIAAHAAILGSIVCLASPMPRRQSEWVLAYLVEAGDGASGRGGASAAAPGTLPHHAERVALAPTRSAPPPAARKPRRQLEHPHLEVASLAPLRAVAPARPRAAAPHDGSQIRDAPSSDPSRSRAAAVSGNGGAGAGAGAGTRGAGAGGDGAGGGDLDSIAHADYASNPPPAYPASARRREQQGTVIVRVLVGADGSVERAEIAESSAFDALDAAALQTVRSRWRFIPARRGGLALESWVLVPIRFALVEVSADRVGSR